MIRRTFLKQSGILTGGLLLSNQLLQAFPADRKLRLAIVGCGDRGNGILSVIRELSSRLETVALCDVLDFRLKEAVKKSGNSSIATYTDYRKLLEDKTIDAIIIATPLNMHFPVAKDAMAAGKHVYLEKTMTYNIKEAIDLVKIKAQHKNLVLQVGHQYRYTPLYYKVREMIAKGYLGKVTQIDCRWDRNWNWRRPVPEASMEKQINWRMYKQYSGGLVAELLSHQIDFINWAFNITPNEVFATGGIDFYKDGRETFDNVQVMLRYAKEGIIGNFGSTCGNARDGYLFKLKGTKGSVSLLMHEGNFYPEPATRKELEVVDGVAGATKIEWNKDGGIPILKEPTKDGTYYALEEFYKCIIENKQPDSNVVTGATTAITVHLANQALYGNGTAKWKDEYSRLSI